MHYNRTINCLLLLLFVSLSATAQPTATPKTLLWRISGNGLQKPSYLFGTMHLNDRRLFKFGDSVYHAIEQCEGLAIEVNPDELAAYYVNRLFDQMENSKKLEEILKADDFKKYSAALEKKFDKPAGKITASDIVKERNKWMSEYMEKGEMPTFVDAYLYNIARRQGKWLGGIEDIADQAGLIEDLVDKSDLEYLLAGDAKTNSKEINKGLERMIELYTDQDLDGVEALSSGHTSAEKKDRILIRRNIKMARRIDSLVNLRTMFLAIGTAHLPGDTGVIDLLRKRGFTVQPVFSSKKLDEKEYTFKEVSIPWYPVEDAQGMYHTLMPGNPAGVKVYGLIEMKFLMDIFNMTGYCTMAVPTANDFTQKDSIYNELARRMLQTDRLQQIKTIYNDGIEGREYIQEKKGANMRLQLFTYKKIMYVSFMSGLKFSSLGSAYADKFFNAFVINKKLVLTASSNVFTDSVMGISFVAPAVMSYNKKLSNIDDVSWKISAFTGSDASTGSYIFLYSKELTAGRYLPGDSLIFEDFAANIDKQYTQVHKQEKLINGYQSVRITGRNILQPSFYTQALCVLQNGRNIVIMAITDSAHLHSPDIDRIFDSLQLVAHPAADWKQYTSPEGSFSSKCPSEIRTYFHSTNNDKQYYSYDTATAVTYSIIPDTLSKYYWAKDDSSYWKSIATGNLADDSLLQKIKITNGALHGIELLTRPFKNLSRYKRMRLLQDGDKLYKLFVSAEKDLLYNQHTNDFFNSFSIHAPSADSLFYITPKTTILLQDLAGKDSAARHNAYSSLASAPFTEKDRDALQEALFKSYQSLYDSSLSNFINNELAEKLAALKSNATVDFVKSRYGSFTERKDTLKNIALSLLAQIKSKESYAALAQLATQSPPAEQFGYTFANELKDSLSLTAGIYPTLQQLAADTNHTSSVADIADKLIDSGFIKLEQVKMADTAFIHAAGQLLPALTRDEFSEYKIYRLVELLGRFKTPAANKMLKDYLAVKNPWLKKAVAMELLKNNQPAPVSVLNGLAADKTTRYSLYTDLKEIKKKQLFPAQYLTQSYFAEAAAYNAAIDDDEDESPGLVFLSKKTAMYKKKLYVFYLYKVVYASDDGPTAYLGIAGGYPVNGAAIEPATDISGVYREKTLDAKNAATLLAAYLKDLEKDPEDLPVE